MLALLLCTILASAAADEYVFPFDSAASSHPGLMVEYKDLRHAPDIRACGAGCVNERPTIRTEAIDRLDFAPNKNLGLTLPSQTERFGVVFRGFLKANVTGKWRLRVDHVDAVRVRVNNRNVVSYWLPCDQQRSEANIDLTQGDNELQVHAAYEYLQSIDPVSTPAMLKLSWRMPNSDQWEVVPPEALTHQTPTVSGRSFSSIERLFKTERDCRSSSWIDQPYLRVDLGGMYTVHSVSFSGRTSDLARHRDLTLRVDADNWEERNWTTSSICNDGAEFDVPHRNTAEWYNVSCGNTVGRWLTLHKNTSHYSLGLCGIRINATRVGDLPSPNSPPPLTTPVVLPPLPSQTAGWQPFPNANAFELRPSLYEFGDAGWSQLDDEWISPRQALKTTGTGFNDRRWQGRAGTRPYVILDLEDSFNITGFTLLNTQGGSDRNGGTRAFVIEAGDPGSNVLLSKGRPVTAVNNSGHGVVTTKLNDGNTTDSDATCEDYQGKLGQPVVYQMDLGSVQPISYVTVHGSRRGFWNMQVFLSATPEVDAEATSCQFSDGLYYYYPGDNNVRRGWRPSATIQCIGSGRYVTVRKRTFDYQPLRVCEIEVVGAPDASWTPVFQGTLHNLQPYNLNNKPIPFQHFKLDNVISARFLRLRLMECQKHACGLNALKIWSPTPLPQHHVVVDVPDRSYPGLKTEMFPLLESIHHNHNPAWSTDLLRDLHRRAPTGTFALPNINLPAKSWNEELTYTTSGTVDWTSATMDVSFPVPFPVVLQQVLLEPHPASVSTTCPAGLNTTVPVTSLRQDGFNLSALPSTLAPCVANDHVRLIWTATSTLPDHPRSSNFDHRHHMGLRFSGTLTAPTTDTYTFLIAVNDLALLYINNTEVLKVESDNLHHYGYFHGEVKVDLIAHQPIPFDLRYANRRDGHGVVLSWRSTTSGTHVVYEEAFHHHVDKLCLQAWGRTNARLTECSSDDSGQRWNIVGNQLQSAETGSQGRYCLHSDNTRAVRLTTCREGGLSVQRAPEGSSNPRNANEEFYQADRLFEYDPSTRRLISLNQRNPNIDPPCQYGDRSTNGRGEALECEKRHNLPARTFCLQPGQGQHGDVIVEAVNCSSDELYPWHITPVDQAMRNEVVMHGAFEHIPGYYFDSQRLELVWMRDEDVCTPGIANNTCHYACDGRCDDDTYPLVSISGSCAPYTDEFDCNFEQRLGICARKCLEELECATFAIDIDHNHNQCRMMKVTPHEVPWSLQYRTQHDFDSYIKLPAAANLDPETIYPSTPDCSAIMTEKQCNHSALHGTCRWQPKPGQPEAALDCQDTNTYPAITGLPFSCKSYKDEFQRCNVDAVANECAVTCDRTEYCPTLEFYCADVTEATTTAAAPVTCPSGPGVSTMAEGKCRCKRGYVCKGAGCTWRSAGNGKSAVQVFDPNTCADCGCEAHRLTDDVTAPPMTSRAPTTSTTTPTTTATTTTTTVSANKGDLDSSNGATEAASETPMGAVVGGAAGALVVIGLVVLALLLAKRKKQRPARVSSEDVLKDKPYMAKRSDSAGSLRGLSQVGTPWEGRDNVVSNAVYERHGQLVETNLDSFKTYDNAPVNNLSASPGGLYVPAVDPYSDRRRASQRSVRLADNDPEPEDA